jgi:hypothetical protein
MVGILESILGNKATEWLGQHNAGASAIGLLILVLAAASFWKRRHAGSSPIAGGSAQATGNVVNQHFHFGPAASNVVPQVPRTSTLPSEAEEYFREQRLHNPPSQRVEHAHRVGPEPPAVGVTSTAGEWEREYKEGLLAEEAPLKVQLTWKPNIGSGCTPGMWFQATNRDPATVESAAVFITDIKRWDDSLETPAFVATPDIHGGGTTFTEVQIGNATLHRGNAENVGFLRYESHRLDIQGQRQENIRMTLPGIRRISYRVQGTNGRKTVGSICFEWKGPQPLGLLPTTCECPRPF